MRVHVTENVTGLYFTEENAVQKILWALCWKYNQNSESSTQNEGLKDS